MKRSVVFVLGVIAGMAAFVGLTAWASLQVHEIDE